MTYKQIEASREIRLWIGQVIIPAIAAGGLILSNPEVRKTIKQKKEDVKNSIKNKFSKEA